MSVAPQAVRVKTATGWQDLATTAARVSDTDHIGTIKAFAGTTIPANWMLADGRSLLRADYPDLFAVIGTTYGAADGTHFNLPDLRSRMIYGATTPAAAGGVGGAATVALSEAEMPSHSHAGTTAGADRSLDHLHTASSGNFYVTAPGSNWTYHYVSGGLLYASGTTGAMDRSIDHLHTFSTNSKGSGTAHNNLPPYILIAQIIKVTGAQISAGNPTVVYDSDQIATVKTFAGTVIPPNWMLCDGRTLSRASYPQLADAMGVPAGNSTFTIPDLRSKMIYGATDPTAQGATGGAATHTLSAAEMPSHQHAGTTGAADRSLEHYHYIGGRTGASSADTNDLMARSAGAAEYWYFSPVGGLRSSAIDHLHAFTTDLRGSGGAHNNLPPYIVLAYIIKVTGVTIDPGGALQGANGSAGAQVWVSAGGFPAGPWPQNVTIALPFKADVQISVGGTLFATAAGVRGLRTRWDGGDMPVSAMQYFNEINTHKYVASKNVVRAAIAGNHTLTFGPVATGSETSDSGDNASYAITAVQVP